MGLGRGLTMNRTARLRRALDGARAYSDSRGARWPILSVIEQLEYLIGLESGSQLDRSKLRQINIGVIAAREIESGDPTLATWLYEISDEVRRGSFDQRG